MPGYIILGVKKLFKSVVAAILGWQIRRLRRKNNFKIIGIAGSFGKTSTKLTIANVLSSNLKTRFQDGNYNDLVSVPLIFFDLTIPSPLMNPLAWLKVFIKIEKQLKAPYPYEVVVVELGTDGPGQIAQFGQYLHCDVGVLTAISPEHMEHFSNLDRVAKEELAIGKYSDLILYNYDLCSDQYIKKAPYQLVSYGFNQQANTQLTNFHLSDNKAAFDLTLPDSSAFKLEVETVSKSTAYSVASAVIIAKQLGLKDSDIVQAIKNIKPVSGRGQVLKGIKDSIIIDETYNASPEAVKLALDTLYLIKAPSRIAVLGNMNELGDYSKKAHEEVGNYCDPTKVDLVITIGNDANAYLAPAASDQGCKVISCSTPEEVGERVKDSLQSQTALLFKGSQNGVFLEEAIKIILENPRDNHLLVRQSKYWLGQKRRAY